MLPLLDGIGEAIVGLDRKYSISSALPRRTPGVPVMDGGVYLRSSLPEPPEAGVPKPKPMCEGVLTELFEAGVPRLLIELVEPRDTGVPRYRSVEPRGVRVARGRLEPEAGVLWMV